MSLKMQAGFYLISVLCYIRGVNFINNVALRKKQSRPTHLINRTDLCKWYRARVVQILYASINTVAIHKM